MQRAEVLGRMLAESGASMAYCSDALRTLQTLEPFKQALGDDLAINEISAAEPGGVGAHVEAVINAVTRLPATAVSVVVSHSNTVGRIIQGLGGDSIAPIADTEFDRLSVLFRPSNGPKTLLKLRY